MHLKGSDILKSEPIGRTAEMATELRCCIHVRSLRRQRQFAEGHVLNHAVVQGAEASLIGVLLSQGSGFNNRNP